MSEPCTAWVGDPANTCGEPAVVRRGVRCRSGCWGEGVFVYGCPRHPLEDDEDLRGCIECGGPTLEWFPARPVPAVPVGDRGQQT